MVATASGIDSAPRIDVFSGTSLATLAPVELIVDSGDQIAFRSQPNQALFIRVSATNSFAGRFRLSLEGYGLRPVNDDRLNASPILSAAPGEPPQTVLRSSTDATREAGEPSHAGVSGGKSLWWRFTAPASGVLRCQTDGSTFDTLLAVYRLGFGVAAASNDDASWWVQWSRVEVRVEAGVAYDIAVDGFGGASGMVVLNATFAPDSNDAYQAAVPIGVGQTLRGSNVDATKQDFEPNFPGDPTGASVWYKWTAPGGGRARVIVTPRTPGLNLKTAVYHDRFGMESLNAFSVLKLITGVRDV